MSAINKTKITKEWRRTSILNNRIRQQAQGKINLREARRLTSMKISIKHKERDNIIFKNKKFHIKSAFYVKIRTEITRLKYSLIRVNGKQTILQ